MKRRFTTLCIGFGVAVFFLTAAPPVDAALGEPADSIAADQTALVAKQAVTGVRNGYTVQELRSDAVTLREYVAPSGIVFAIAWEGLVHPDLTALLGSYASEYETALRHDTRRHGLRRHRLETGRIVVEKWGPMRNLQGRAYVPALIPPGVCIDEIE